MSRASPATVNPEPLLEWYRREQRSLPWRASRDPYAIWISEAMLQQTRVETAQSYWLRFLQRFPDVRSLAAAEEDEVLALWSGLGYYRRARSLLAAARAIVAQHEGRFPSTRAELLALPGVGPYTAGAVLSIAFDQPEAVVDGNVSRVFCRWFGLEGDPSSGAMLRELWSRARALVPAHGSGEWNQALMELGATVCTPSAPACERCPLAPACVAHTQDRVHELPHPKARKPTVAVELEVLLARRGDALLLERRPGQGRMAGMWQPPTIEVRRDGPGQGLYPSVWPGGGILIAKEALGEVRHTITHHRIRARVRSGGLTRGARVRPPLAWIPAERLRRTALTGMARKIFAAPFGGPL